MNRIVGVFVNAALLLACVLPSTSVVAQTVYRSVDDQGNVTYSDQQSPGSKKVIVAPVQTYDSRAIPQNSIVPSAPKPPPAKPVYTEFVIVSPADDEAVRSNSGDLTIGVRLNPELREGDRISFAVDGKAHGEPTRSTVQTLPAVDRGTHSLSAAVIDADGNRIATAPPVTFHLLRAVRRAN